MESHETQFGFMWGPHFVVERVAAMGDGRLVLNVYSRDGDIKNITAEVQLILSPNGKRITVYPRKNARLSEPVAQP